jgi:16S rRNA (guanine(966)-N(2))-methyltransferase RsmD
MFNVITSRLDLEGAIVADLFCGSGSLGLEAYSRGASRIEFVDRESSSLSLARNNALTLDEHAPCRFIRSDARAWASSQPSATYDLILADPPYHAEGVDSLIDVMLPLLKADGLFILEHDRSLRLPQHAALEDVRTYGKTAVAIYHKTSTDVDA